MTATIIPLPTPTHEPRPECGPFSYIAGQGYRGPKTYMLKRGHVIIDRYENKPLLETLAPDGVLRALARDYADMTVPYTPEKPLKVGDFDYDGARVGGPANYMEARGLALLAAQQEGIDSFALSMRDVLEVVRRDYAACRRRMTRWAREADTPIPDDLRFFLH